MFHWKDGWFFERLSDGSVAIIKKYESKDNSQVITTALIPKDEWCSIIATMSGEGESGEKYQEARQFHNNDRLVECVSN